MTHIVATRTAVASLGDGGGGRRTAPGDTLQGGDTRVKSKKVTAVIQW